MTRQAMWDDNFGTAGDDAREEAMITHLPGLQLPVESTLDINIRVTQPLNVTAFSAQQRVTQYVMQELSTQFGGDTPELTVAERVYCSVPVVFTLPGKGALGRVGTLRIDRKSTRLNSSHRCISYAVFCLKKKSQ